MTVIALLLLGAAFTGLVVCAIQPKKVERQMQERADDEADARLYFRMIRVRADV